MPTFSCLSIENRHLLNYNTASYQVSFVMKSCMHEEDLLTTHSSGQNFLPVFATSKKQRYRHQRFFYMNFVK